MRTILITLLILLLSAGTVIYKTMPKTENSILSVIYDLTSKQKAKPEPEGIIPLLGLSSNEWNGSQFRTQPITDVSLNVIKEASIPSQNEWLNNNYDRDNEVSQYYNRVKQTITDSLEESVGRQHSDIYVSLATELNYLAVSRADHKILLVYSDLEENLSDFSVYRKKDFSLLTISPEKVESYFLKKVPLGNLTGIEVHLIYQPENIADDNLYRAISGLYKSLLVSHGANVIIQANL